MRLSVVFELLLVFLFLAFAAARVIDPAKGIKNVAKKNKKVTTLRQGPPNRYCACTSKMCNCCRDFSLPVVPLKGPGCASIMYVQRDTMMVTMTFGDRVLSNTTITGKTPKPVCMALPGGISQFCGRVYGISRKGDQFRACLGLELRALDDIEAALRVSCFKFGPKGVKLESAPPVPSESGGKEPEEEDEEDYDLDDDEDDDLIGFGVDEDDEGASSEDNEVDSDSVDYTGFSVLGEDILGTLFSDDSVSSNAKKKKPSKKTAKPQVIAPKISTTTRKPILPNRRRSTIRPLSSLVTKKPVVNRITKRPANRPQIFQRPSVSINTLLQTTTRPTFLPVSSTLITKYDLDKNIVSKSPVTTTETPQTTMRLTATSHSQENEKFHTSEETTVTTEEPITFTIPTQRIEVKNDIKLPQTDLDKVEAVVAIAQQDVTSGVISSSSLTSEETEKPLELATVKYEKISPSHVSEISPSYIPEITEKISSIKFIPTTVVTSRPSAELADESDSLDKITNSEMSKPSEFEVIGIKNKVTVPQEITVSTVSDKKKQGNNGDDKNVLATIEENSLTKKDNFTVSLKKQPVKKKPEKEKEEEEEEEEEEDLLEGVLSDDDDSDNEGAENNDDNSISQPSTNKDKDEASNNDEEENADEEEEDDISGETVETGQKVKPTKVSIKEKPSSDDSENEDEDEDEEEEEDILDVLGDDDDEEESDDDEEDNDTAKEKIRRKTATQATTVKNKKPTTQKIIQTKKPVTTTEKVAIPTTLEEKVTEKVTEKIFTLKEPVEKVTQKVIIYQEPEHKIPNKIFLYTESENQNEKPTEKIIFYKEPPQQTITEKFVIYKEPEEKITEKPTVIVQYNNKSSEEDKDDSEEEDKIENDENSSEEELEDDNESEKHTFVASIAKPGFSNKYAEEHDLTENDDLDIEDSEDDALDFDEDRKMKENRKKPIVKPFNNKKLEAHVNKPKVLTLSDLIGQRNKHNDDKPISTSRTHRRMNLDRLLKVQ